MTPQDSPYYTFSRKNQEHTINTFTSYKAYVENQCQHKISTIRTNNGGEYFSDEWKRFCEQNGIRHVHIVPYNPQGNGIAKCKNQTLLDACRSMIQVDGLPL